MYSQEMGRKAGDYQMVSASSSSMPFSEELLSCGHEEAVRCTHGAL